MSRRSRANPWWERCEFLGHDCRWCRAATSRAVHLGMGLVVIDLGREPDYGIEFVQPLVPELQPVRSDSLTMIAGMFRSGDR